MTTNPAPKFFFLWIPFQMLLFVGTLVIYFQGGSLPNASWGLYYGNRGHLIGLILDYLLLLLPMIIIVGIARRRIVGLYASYLYVVIAIILRVAGAMILFEPRRLPMIVIFMLFGYFIYRERVWFEMSATSSKPI